MQRLYLKILVVTSATPQPPSRRAYGIVLKILRDFFLELLCSQSW